MKTKRISFRKLNSVIALILITYTFFLEPTTLSAASMSDYCVVPPYVKTEVKPNIMIIMDNALGMAGRAYTDPYDPATPYEGYFQSDLMYKYNSPRWEPSSSAPAPPEPYMSGNLLNWATTSRYDLLQKILVGGISTSRQTNVNTLVSKSNAWTATLIYTGRETGQSRTCLFVVDNANVEIKDNAGGSCGYFDSPRDPVNESRDVASIGPDTKFAMMQTSIPHHTPPAVQNDRSQDEQEILNADSLNNNEVEGKIGLLFSLWSNFINFLIPDAEAAKPLAISPGTPSDGTECTAYAYTLSAAGGTGAGYTWDITAGSLPPGLTLTTVGTPGSGSISGNPTTAGSYTFTVRVRDSGASVDTKNYTIDITAVTLTITTTSPLPDAMETAAYSTTISTNNVCTTGGYAWSITSGSLPIGLSLNASTGVISGTPATAGSYNFTVQVVGYGAHIATKIFTLTVLPAPVVLTITTTSPLPDATEDSAYTTTITAMNYVGACTWSVIAGSLPSGLTLDAAGTPSTSLHGTPTTIGTYNFTIQVNSPGALGTPATKVFSLTVLAMPVRTTGNLNVRVCIGAYDLNCTNAPAGTVLKTGIVDEFWSQARYGIQDFNKQAGAGVPNISNCIEQSPDATPDENFLTNIENAVPIDVITPMVDAEWTDVDNFANGTGTCDPFTGAGNCPKNFILMITDGVGANQNNNATKIYTAANGYTVSAGCSDTDYVNLTKNSCFGYNTDLRNNPTFGATNITGKQIVSTYIVNTMGAAMTAGYNPETSPTTTGDILYQAAGKGGGQYYPVTDAAELRETLIEAFKDIIKRAAAGTAASVLASGEGSGANLVQAVFYPRRKFFKSLAGDYDEIAWIGRLTNLWYYVDPFFGNSNIREDGTGDKILNLDTDIGNDYIAQLYFDTTAEQTKARRWADTNGDGVVDGSQLSPDIEFEKMGALWEAGLELWKRDITSDPRGIITWLDKDSDGIVDSGELIDFSSASYSALSAGDKATMRTSLQAADDTEAENIIRYINGEDLSYRTRSVKVDLNNDGDTSDAGEDYKVWKLGDVLNSTPKISSWLPLNSFNTVYSDGTYSSYLNTTGAGTPDYKNRGMVVAGANDGMLHAFNLGKLELSWSGQTTTQKARLTGSNFGKELGAFIPKNALPYLKYQMLPGYCHIYTVDLTPYLFDASINKYATCSETNYWDCAKTVDSWRTILIGGMRYGGACRNSTTTCTDVSGDGAKDCVNTPVSGIGYSSYFALDVTDQNNPQLLWEFSSPELGFATSGPAVIRINARDVNGVSSPNQNKNGRWFVVLGSGPTGPITTDNTTQFLGRSDQNLKIFILDLKTGALATTNPIDTGIQYAFAGSLLNATHDSDTDYQDDVAYIPYVKRTGSSPNYTWTDGGILRLVTREDLSDANLNNTALYPDNWVYSTVMDGIGPVTSSIVRLQNKNTGQLWLYFGTGRYFFEQGSTTDDATGQRQVFGIKEPCFQSGTFLNVCTDTNTGNDLSRSFGDLTNVTDIANIPSDPDVAGFYGWYINLDPDVSTASPNTYTNCNGVGTTTCAAGKYGYCEGNPATVVCRDYKAERVITDPLATSSGLVFFTTYKPYSDECALGGKSFIWATKYNTGGAGGSLLKGKALVQVSTGSIEQMDLSTAFSEKGGRRSSAMKGVPPTAQGLSLISTPPAVKRILHIRER